eukprot:3178888-Prymnesium_polylepis.2
MCGVAGGGLTDHGKARPCERSRRRPSSLMSEPSSRSNTRHGTAEMLKSSPRAAGCVPPLGSASHGMAVRRRSNSSSSS